MKKENQDAAFSRAILAANLYYKHHLSQQQISQMLQISRPWVSKLLAKAEESGIVEIHVNSSVYEDRALSGRLRERYGLRYACAVDTARGGSGSSAAAAANYFLSQLRPESTVSIGWGKSIARVLADMPPVHVPGLRIIPMAGSFGTTMETMPNYSTIQAAEKTGGTAVPLHAPAFCASEEEYAAMHTNPVFSEVLRQAEQADVTLAGVGVLDDTLAARTGIFSAEQVEELRRCGAVGDIALSFFDREGAPIHTELTRRIICVDWARIVRQSRSVIVFAEGLDKVDAIRAALRGGLMTSLITSAETAHAILEEV